ncbi:hypothetical protein EJ110_NYTH50025 [Nymphaea thermarum]|nr:hypothetical protein EJ110_NYTH50025 [Nymphaea thermarum]
MIALKFVFPTTNSFQRRLNGHPPASSYFYCNFAERNMACFSLGLQKMSCFKDQHQENAKGRDLVVESADGGEDILDAASVSTAKHLVVMVNGLVGSAEDWSFAADQFVKKFPDKVIVHRECLSLFNLKNFLLCEQIS